jgi:hypothetical protein
VIRFFNEYLKKNQLKEQYEVSPPPVVGVFFTNKELSE